MAFTKSVAQGIANRWVKGRCLGFKDSANANAVIADFKVYETGEMIRKFFNDPINLRELNELRIACGLDQLRNAADVELPSIGDSDMMGYDADVLIYSVSRGNHVNARNFRALEGAATASPQTAGASASSVDQPLF